MIGRWACLFADCHHRSTDRKAHDFFEGHHPAVDDWQASGNAAHLDMLAVVAAEVSAASESQNVAPTADREMATFGLESACNVIAVILQTRTSRFVHARLSTTGATNGFRGL
jgi:hypothetical protein